MNQISNLLKMLSEIRTMVTAPSTLNKTAAVNKPVSTDAEQQCFAAARDIESQLIGGKADPAIEAAFGAITDAVNLTNTAAREDYLRRLAEIRRRYDDPYLNLAIIGNFSCGKSTFINAVLRQPLLSMDMQPTTAVPTYIRWNQPGRDKPCIVACDHAGASYELSGEGRSAFEASIGMQLPEDNGRLIDAITTSNALIEKISRVSLFFPEQDVFRGLCLVDTPGVNPGAEDTREHVNITRSVLHREADAAIILFPANQVFTGSFEAFLTEHAAHLINNSAFIITKFDMVKSRKDKEKLPWFVAENLKKIGVKDPKIYCTSAALALECYQDGENADPASVQWKDRFEADVSEIFSYVYDRRREIVRSSIGAMLGDMIRSISKDISSSAQALREAEENLEKYSPAAMRVSCEAIAEAYNSNLVDQLRKRKYNMSLAVKQVVNQKETDIHARIRATTSAGELNRYMKYQLRTDLSDLPQKLTELVQDVNMELKHDYLQFAARMEARLKEYRLNINGAANVAEASHSHEVSVDMEEIELDTNSGTSTGFLDVLGDLGSGLIDTLDDLTDLNLLDALEDVITMIGDVIYDVFALFKPMSDRHQKAISSLTGFFENSLKKGRSSCAASLTRLNDSYSYAAGQLIDRLESTYHVEFDNMLRRFNAEKAEIQSKLERHRSAAENLEALEDKICDYTAEQCYEIGVQFAREDSDRFDPNASRRWLARAAAKGMTDAQELLDSL